MTSQRTARGRFSRFIKQRNLFDVEIAIREMGTISLLDALDYLDLLAEVKPEKLERAAVRWHGRLEADPAAAHRFTASGVSPTTGTIDALLIAARIDEAMTRPAKGRTCCRLELGLV
jgi:hypothetical protein